MPVTDPRSVPTPHRAWPDGLSSRDALTVLILGVLVGVSYFPALLGGFVWDDVIFAEEPVVQRWSGLWNIWFSPADIKNEGHYWPVVYTTFWLEHKLWGLAPLGYHLVNLLLHWVNSLLVWRLLRRLAVPGAWAVAAVFAVHPLHVESVAWIIERKDLLSALFYLTAALTWVRFVEGPGWGRYGLALALFTAGLLSKSVVVTFPVALLIWHWWQRDRVTSTDLFRLAPFFAVGLAVTLADFSFYTSREPLALGYSLIERVLIASRALWFYVGKLLWPADLAVIYPLWDIRAGDPLAWAYLAAAVAVAVLLWLGRHRVGRGPLAGVLFYAVTLSPVLGFVDYGYMQFALVADRFQYLAGIGVMATLIGGGAYAVGRLPAPARMTANGLLAAALALLGTLTWIQAQVYRNGVSLFSHIASLNPSARDVYLNLGSALFKSNRLEEALAASRLAVKHRPDSAGALSNVGRGLMYLGQLDEAERYLRRALEIDPRNTPFRQNLAETLRQQKRYREAAEAYRATLATDSRYARAYAGLGTTLYHLKRYEEAVAAMERSLSLELDSSMAGPLRLLLGQALQKTNRLDAAAEHYQRAASRDPRDVRPLRHLAQLRNAQGRTEEADGYLRRIRELRPNDAATHEIEAEVLRERSRYEEAVASYHAALRVDPDYAPAHAGLGRTLLAMKRNEEALASLTRSLALEPDSPAAAARHVLAGQAAHALNQVQTAVDHFNRVRILDPHNTYAMDHLAMLRFGQKRYQEALVLYLKMLEVQPDDAQIHANAGATLYYLGRPEEARRRFERALALKPDLASARAGLKAAQKKLEQTVR